MVLAYGNIYGLTEPFLQYGAAFGNSDLLHGRSLESSHCGIESRDLVKRIV